MREVAVIGIGETTFGRHTERTLTDLGVEACLKAIRDANIEPRDIQVVYVGNCVQWTMKQGGPLVGQTVGRELGITKIPITRVENGCATGSCAFREAWYKVATGECDTALAFGVEQMTVVDSSVILGAFGGNQFPERHGDMGLAPPALFALVAKRHMAEFGTTREQFAMVAVKNRKYGALNPDAQRHNPVSLEEVLNDTMICDPITRSQCCPRGDGAACVILTTKERANRYTSTPVYVAASVQTSGSYAQDQSFTSFDADVRAAKAAYDMAGLGPEDLDLAEVHDCFTPAEIIHYEALGFCPKGEGGRFIEEGLSDIGGKIAVSTSGGLLSKGHVIGATGVSQIVEVVKQLRGEAGQRQVEGAKVGLQHNSGGYLHTDICCCVIDIFKR